MDPSSPLPSDAELDSPPPPPRQSRFELGPMTSLNSTREHSPSDEPLSTPTLAESYSQMKKNLSFRSLRDLEMRELHTAVWRKGGRGEPGERRHRPRNMDEVFNHALRGGIRSFLLASGVRAGVNLLVVALRISRKRKIRPSLILHALFGVDTVRFGGMLGLFTFLYKITLHALRLFNIGKKGFGQEEAWHAALAGAVSGLAVWAEKPSRRITIGQQMLVRGLQGNYNILKQRGWVNLPNGEVIIFGLACGEIMYSWLMAPEALPSGYRRWITNASRVAEPCLPVNLSTARTGTFDPAIVRSAITWKSGATPKNATLIEAYAAKGERGDFGPPFAPCEVVHPWVDSCTWVAVDRWQAVFRWMFPVYAALHVIPPILLRYKVFLKDPQKALLKSAFGTLRSCSFLATFVIIFQGMVCGQRNMYKVLHGRIPALLEQMLVSKYYYWLCGFCTCLSLFIEEKKRRGELAMYVLPRGMESLWSILRRRSWVPFVPGGEVLMTSIGLSMVMTTYQHQPKLLSGLVRAVLWQFVGQG